MEAVVERGNMTAAYERVVANQGAAGADGMSVDELKGYLHVHWVTSTAWDLSRCSSCNEVSELKHKPPDREPYVRWCGRTESASSPPTRLC